MGFILKLFGFLLLLKIFMFCTDTVEGINVASRYFLTIDISTNGRTYGGYSLSLLDIKSILCDATRKTVECFLNFKVVGEPKVLLVMNVENSAELERRLSVLARRNAFKYESEPIVDYANFAIKTLGVSNGTAILEGNTLNQSVEIIYCEFNINFGVKTAAEGLATWKREAEAVFNSRKSGSAVEIFKTLGERTVHLMTEMTASSLDEILFLVPFAQEIPNTLGTRCKVARKF